VDGVRAFYDGLAPLYHLVYQDWEASVARQGAALAALIDEHWGASARVVLDAAVVSMRDYGAPPPSGTVEVHPYGERLWKGRRHQLRQVWRWKGSRYDVRMELAPMETPDAPAMVLDTTYFAIAPARVADLMTALGFTGVRRLDGRLHQPVLIGTRPAQS
jgi:hypothetical protein